MQDKSNTVRVTTIYSDPIITKKDMKYDYPSFKAFGYVISIRNPKIHWVPFSLREGITKSWKIFGWMIAARKIRKP